MRMHTDNKADTDPFSARLRNCFIDLQMVNITCRVLSRPSIPELPTIYRELGQDYDERVLPSIVNEVLKSVIAQFNASQCTQATYRDNRLESMLIGVSILSALQ